MLFLLRRNCYLHCKHTNGLCHLESDQCLCKCCQRSFLLLHPEHIHQRKNNQFHQLCMLCRTGTHCSQCLLFVRIPDKQHSSFRLHSNTTCSPYHICMKSLNHPIKHGSMCHIHSVSNQYCRSIYRPKSIYRYMKIHQVSNSRNHHRTHKLRKKIQHGYHNLKRSRFLRGSDNTQ